jgi:hypothetical protein
MRGTNCDKQTTSSIQCYKFKFDLGFTLTIFLQCTEFLSLSELPLFRLFDSDCFQPSSHQPNVYYLSIQPVARLSRIIGAFCECSRHEPSQCLHRPVEGNERVKPDALHNYRKTHQFLGPCCLCPLLTPLSREYHFTEAAVYVPIFGRYAGEYVAECAKSRCGYLG